ncbi:unnamed protein product [Ophioblennius macclurei]
MASVFQLFLLPLLVPVLLVAGVDYHLITGPQPPALEIGTNFTATCTIVNTTEVKVEDLYWKMSGIAVPKKRYTKVNETALNVTIVVERDMAPWLYCLCNTDSIYVRLNPSKFHHGIYLRRGYFPDKPENLSCEAVQHKSTIAPAITCRWDTRERSTDTVPTVHTLFLKVGGETFHQVGSTHEAQVVLEVFPNYMAIEVWVVANNTLGLVESEHLLTESNSLMKMDPPSDVHAISEKSFSSSLLVNWTHSIRRDYLKLIFQIRFCPHGSTDWTYVPLGETSLDIRSFRLQNLKPNTLYDSQVRCKFHKVDQGYWSEWSANATQRTPEDRPSGKPNLWRIITDDGANGRQVEIVSKDPQPANGRIIGFNIRIQDQKAKSGEWHRVPANSSEMSHLKRIPLPESRSAMAHVVAVNSAGTSPEAVIGITGNLHELRPVQGLRVWPQDGRLQVEWKALNVTEYVVEWTAGGVMDWQRESRLTTRTTITGSLQPFICYNVSVYPIYSVWVGKAARVEAFLKEGAPTQAPEAILQGDPGRNDARLTWNQVLDPYRRGFITNYTLFYGDGAHVDYISMPGTATTYRLRSLSANTKYDVWIQASTAAGSKNGSKSYFTTHKYAPGEIEAIVVGVSLGLMFVFLLSMLLCVYKRDVIKENFWPQIPNPGDSTIGTWSPDYSLKAETPKENCLSGISVLDMDMCDGRYVFEEDKASLALKKDKYLSEEHSSGIGGSSCMSSPRQSVSDSDEGGDMAETTASTVQYSSVVASSGYKGQTPSSQGQQAVFSRSESTQPLLDSEENPDVAPAQHRFPRQPCFEGGEGDRLEMELQDVVEPLDFCPLEEDAEPTAAAVDGPSADWPPNRPASSYMPQLGGYRPQRE